MRAVALAFVLCCSPAAFAQPSVDPDAMIARLEASQAAAQAAAIRPGDEEMTCEALQAEFTAVMNDPAMRQAQAEMGQWAQERQAQMNQARGQAMAQVGVSVGMGIASSFIPGLGYAQQAMMMAQTRRMQRQAAQNQTETIEQAANAQAMLPAAYRGQRLYDLAQAKHCAFLQEQAPAPQ
jgi:hypothetical protein